MRKGYKITLGMLTIMILLTITVGTSYSYYSISDEQTNPNTLVSTCFNFSFTESNNIKLNADGNYAYPMSEATATSKLTPYEFTITNTCTASNSSVDIKYDILLNTVKSTPSTLTSYLKYKLNVKAPTAVAGTSAMLNKTIYNLNNNIKTEHDIDTSYSIGSGTLAPGETKTYNLYLWIDENAGNDVMGNNFEGKLLVYGYI